MQAAYDRRQEILLYLSDIRETTLAELSCKYQVSISTVRRDLDRLSAKYPIYTKSGVGGGVFVLDNFHYRQAQDLTPEQDELLHRLYDGLHGKDKEIMGSIIDAFTFSSA